MMWNIHTVNFFMNTYDMIQYDMIQSHQLLAILCDCTPSKQVVQSHPQKTIRHAIKKYILSTTFPAVQL